MCGTVLSSKTVKIRKPRNCWGCTKRFENGTDMSVTTTADSGQINSAYWCSECMKLPNTSGEECFDYGEFKQYADEYGPKSINER